MSIRRTLLIGVVVYGLILIGIGALSGAVIAAALPLVLYLGSVLLFQPGPLELDVIRSLDRDYVVPEAPVTVTLTVENRGTHLEEVMVRDGVPEELEVTGHTGALVSLAPGQTFVLSYKVTGPRGMYRFGGPVIAAYETFALFRRERTYSVPGKLSVLPRTPEMRSIAIRPLRTRGFAGPIPSRQGGSGTDFFGVRSYEPGDPPRWLNWRLSARHPRELFTNEFERERIADVGIILDARERTDVVADGTSLFEYSVRAASALSEVFLGDGNHVALLIYGRGLERTFPGYGRVQRQKILRALSQARVGDSLVFDSLDYLPTRFFPAKSQIVLVSPLCEDDPAVLSRLRARGYEVLIVSPDPIAFEGRALPPSPARDLALRIAQAERALWVQQLERVGARVISWDVDQPLDTTIGANLRRAAHRMRRL